MSTNNALRRALLAATAAGALVVLGGCADGTHPGAAAVVGNEQISVSEVQDLTTAANDGIAEAAVKLKEPGLTLTPDVVISSLVQAALVEQIAARRSVTPTPAEIATAEKEFNFRPVVAEGFQLGGQLTQDFKVALVRTALSTAKLGGSTSIADQNASAAGGRIIAEELKNIEITISPRYGKWDPAAGLDTKASGSLSELSPQTKAIKDAEEAKRQAEQQQPQG
ncbi:SurA N-terminal domain-containing protein [Kribbella sp. NBC_01245]|uniref:hypothetical protein n=1 Tax=Kribbella sp. NBC_01245 TaxID=2903578 RepID=UPI002E2CB17C|nr:hypothetical protein [Kribbella sp. NBC_01245]